MAQVIATGGTPGRPSFLTGAGAAFTSAREQISKDQERKRKRETEAETAENRAFITRGILENQGDPKATQQFLITNFDKLGGFELGDLQKVIAQQKPDIRQGPGNVLGEVTGGVGEAAFRPLEGAEAPKKRVGVSITDLETDALFQGVKVGDRLHRLDPETNEVDLEPLPENFIETPTRISAATREGLTRAGQTIAKREMARLEVATNRYISASDQVITEMETGGAVTIGPAGFVIRGLDTVVAQAKAFNDLLDPEGDRNKAISTSQIEKIIKGTPLAGRSRILKGLFINMAFTKLAANDQTGRGVSAFEFKTQMEALAESSGSPEQIIAVMRQGQREMVEAYRFNITALKRQGFRVEAAEFNLPVAPAVSTGEKTARQLRIEKLRQEIATP